jgi:hypothetical protein
MYLTRRLLLLLVLLALADVCESAEVAIDWLAGFANPTSRAVDIKTGGAVKFTWSNSHNVL